MAVKLDLLGQSGGCGLQGFDAGAPAHLAKGEAYGAATTPKSAPDMAFLPYVRRLNYGSAVSAKNLLGFVPLVCRPF